jgi:predicted dehydrogenase
MDPRSAAAPIRIATIGAGQRASDELAAMARSGCAEPVGFWNRTPAAAHELARRAGLGRRAAGFAGVAEMIERTAPDLVNVVTHPSARLPLIREAIDAGAGALLVEKPVALTRGELAELRVLSERAFIVVNTQYRWMSHWQRFWRVLGDGGIGDIRSIRVSTAVDVLEQGPHLLSLALAAARVSGLPLPTWVLAGGAGVNRFGDVEVPADLTAVMDLGSARLQMIAGPSAPRVGDEDVVFYQQQVEIVGSAGRIWSSLTRGWELWTEDGFTSGSTEWPRDDIQSQADLLTDLAAAIRDPALRAGFPTALDRSAEEADVLFACIDAVRRSGRAPVRG